MAQAVWNNVGVFWICRFLSFHHGAHYPPVLRLFVNDLDPSPDDVTADYTECSLSGYASVDIAALSFTFFASGGVGEGDGAPIVFNFNPYAGPPVTIFGLYIQTGDSPTDLLLQQRFDVPFVVPLSGGPFPLYPTFTARRFAL